tara:strand:+ start:2428 stop:3366 length:939 start_codon:yes stop_codon:yes gene_type:complete
MKKPKISVIIPARNEEEMIGNVLKTLQNQSYKNFEIVVSNDGSTDNTKKIVEKIIKEDKRIRILNRVEGHSAAFARNRGAEVSKGEILVFLDADTYVNRDFLKSVSEKYDKADAFITLNFPDKKKIISKILAGLVGPSKKVYISDGKVYDKNNCEEAGTMFFVITKYAYSKIGGYDESIFYYEDIDFVNKFYSMGFKSIFVKNAKQYFELPSTFSEFFRQCSWIGKGTNSIKVKKDKNKKKSIWILKTSFLLSPFLFIYSYKLLLISFFITLGISYMGILFRNKKPGLSLFVLPFFYLKTFLVTFNILKYWK